jgi:hypothetical protein
MRICRRIQFVSKFGNFTQPQALPQRTPNLKLGLSQILEWKGVLLLRIFRRVPRPLLCDFPGAGRGLGEVKILKYFFLNL